MVPPFSYIFPKYLSGNPGGNDIKDVSPEFNHPFYWSIGNKYLTKAKKIWSKE